MRLWPIEPPAQAELLLLARLLKRSRQKTKTGNKLSLKT
jgi:hypothetical protein